MKDLIIINSYTPDYEREELLRSFVKQIDKTDFDLMVVSHSRLPDDLYEIVDFFIFDKENELKYDLYSKMETWWGNSNLGIKTTEAKPFNHNIAAYKLFFVGINNAKNLGYKKAHVIEYDTSLKDMSFFEDNSKLLDEYSIVYYKNPVNITPVLVSFPMSYNIDELHEGWFTFQKEEILRGPIKTLEDWEFKMVTEQSNTYAKSSDDLHSEDITINLYCAFGEEIWTCPVVDEENNLNLFNNNIQKDTLDVKVVINETIIKNINTKPYNWSCLPLISYKDINTLLIIKDQKEIIKYDFTQINKEDYKKMNRIKYKK
tara:strand:- start:785 stop:1732 length:948 start_codon:yes stop_codon:yes gene_type:complete